MAKILVAQLKAAAALVAESYDIDISAANKIIGFYAGKPEQIAICSGDLTPVKPAAKKLHIKLNTIPANEPLLPDSLSASSETVSNNDIVEYTDISTAALLGDESDVPAAILNDIDNIIKAYCIKYRVDDLRKAPATVWRGACMAVGFHMKKTKCLRDLPKEKINGGICLNGSLIASLVPVWAYLCSMYDKAPLAGDFIAFTGVSSAWFYNCNGNSELSSAGARVYKKLLELQEVGLSAALVDGRRNPTGMIFFLKNWHGWRDQREIVHTDNSGAAAASYPAFNVLEDKSGGDI